MEERSVRMAHDRSPSDAIMLPLGSCLHAVGTARAGVEAQKHDGPSGSLSTRRAVPMERHRAHAPARGTKSPLATMAVFPLSSQREPVEVGGCYH